MVLKYKENFWDFYKENQKNVEQIIWFNIWKHKTDIEAEDLHNEVLVRLHRSTFLKNFDPSKAQLHTHLTNTIRGAISHILEASQYKKIWWEGSDETSRRYYKQTLANGINGITEEDNVTCIDLYSDTSIEEDLAAKQLLETIMKALPKDLKIALSFILKGYNQKAFARYLKMSYQWASVKNASIKRIAQKVVNFINQESTYVQ